MRRVLAAAAAAIVGCCAGLAGCSPQPPDRVCPAIGWTSEAHLTLSAPQPGIGLTLCDGQCRPSADASSRTSYPPIDDLYSLVGDGESGWVATFGFIGPDRLGFRLVDSDGPLLLADDVVDVEWTRVGGSAECGGPHEASVELPIG